MCSFAAARARVALGVRPAQDGFVGLAGERAFFYLRIGDAEETAAAPVERELVLAEILRVIRRELTGGVQANLVQHPPKIDQTSDFVVATAQAWNVLHKRNMNRKQALVTFLQMPSLASRDRASSSATPRASPVAARPDLSPIRRKTLPVLRARRVRICPRPIRIALPSRRQR